jgi:hypothetical protein
VLNEVFVRGVGGEAQCNSEVLTGALLAESPPRDPTENERRRVIRHESNSVVVVCDGRLEISTVAEEAGAVVVCQSKVGIEADGLVPTAHLFFRIGDVATALEPLLRSEFGLGHLRCSFGGLLIVGGGI